MTRVLRQVDVTRTARPVAPPSALDDPALRAVLDSEVESAYARGLAEGEARGRQDAAATASVLAEALQRAVATAQGASASIVEQLAGGINVIAVEVARTVVGQFEGEGNGVLHRVEMALRAIDDRPLRVEANPADLEVLQAAAPDDVEVVAAPDLQPGEARVHGQWADADLTWQAVWESVREALDVD